MNDCSVAVGATAFLACFAPFQTGDRSLMSCGHSRKQWEVARAHAHDDNVGRKLHSISIGKVENEANDVLTGS